MSPSDFPIITRSVIEQPISFTDTKTYFDAGAIILVDKPAGWTSFDVVNKLRNVIKAKRVGHCGTLDPFATGLLIVCTGQATKIVDKLSGCDKEYVAEFELGKITDTLDCDGTVIEEKTVGPLTAVELQANFQNFIGETEQIPPQYSAIKVNGVPLYKKARRGEFVEIKPRKIRIEKFELERFETNLITACIRCSKGTYIRALARDIGEKLGCGAYVKKLRRTWIGDYAVADALAIDEFKNWVSSVHVVN